MVKRPQPITVVVVGDTHRAATFRSAIDALGPALAAATRFEGNARPTETIVAEARAAAPSQGVVVVVEREADVEGHLAQGADEVLVEPMSVDALARAVRHAALRASVRDDHAIEARTLERVLAGLSHGAEPALAALALDLDGLRAGSLETLDDFDAALDDCARAADQIGQLLRDASVLAQVDDDDTRTQLSIEPLLAQVLHALGGNASLQAHIEVNAEDELPAVVAPRRRLARTLASLVIQILDATPADPPPALRRLRISVRGLPHAVALAFDVRPALDTPPSSTRFALANEGRLAVTRAALRSFDAELFTERSVDGGMRMVVFLPLPHSVAQPVSPDVMPALSVATRKRRRVLVVDRDARVLRAISRALSDRYDVLVAIGADEALALVREVDVDVVVLDPRLQDLPGSSLADELVRNHPALANRILLLGSAAEGTAPQGAPVLKKPLRRAALLIAIESCLPVTASRVLN